MYDIYDHQSHHRNQHSYTTNGSYTSNMPSVYGDHVDNNWMFEPRTITDISKIFKVQDKMDNIEITSKDLSPLIINSNLDSLLPDSNKITTTNNNKLQDSLWYEQKYNEYPSCAQYNRQYNMNEKVKYCSIQKQNEILNYNYESDLSSFQNMQSYNKYPKPYGQEVTNYPMYNYEKTPEINTQSEFYSNDNLICTDNLQFSQIDDLEQHSEESQESDIIVEESEGEVADYANFEKLQNTTCTICNVLYTPIVTQFYVLTTDSPLTMSSQKPVLAKLTEIVGKINNKFCYLCSCCLELVNTIDHLQFNLENSKYELMRKFKVSNDINGVISQKSCNQINKKLCKHRFKCKICKKIFCVKNIYRCHMKNHKLKSLYLCEICGKKLNTFSKLLIHLKSHKLQNNVKYQAFLCNYCNKSFRTRTNLKEHENYCSGTFPYVCKYSACNKKFATNSKLKSHVKLKHDKKFTSICSICNIGFIKPSDHKSHMVSHSTDKKFPCSLCDKTYKTLSNLNFHLKFHNKKLPYNCEICNKGFMRKEYLESHVNVHNGVKKFSCQMCDKKFVSQKYLDAHLRYHDGTVKRKSCNICGKSVTTGLEDHIRSHNNEREFKCDKCGMQFNTKGALSKHVKKKRNCL